MKTSYELSLILTQFACDELSVLSKGATTCVLSLANRHDLQMALVIIFYIHYSHRQYFFIIIIRPPPELLPVLGLLER